MWRIQCWTAILASWVISSILSAGTALEQLPANYQRIKLLTNEAEISKQAYKINPAPFASKSHDDLNLGIKETHLDTLESARERVGVTDNSQWLEEVENGAKSLKAADRDKARSSKESEQSVSQVLKRNGKDKIDVLKSTSANDDILKAKTKKRLPERKTNTGTEESEERIDAFHEASTTTAEIPGLLSSYFSRIGTKNFAVEKNDLVDSASTTESNSASNKDQTLSVKNPNLLLTHTLTSRVNYSPESETLKDSSEFSHSHKIEIVPTAKEESKDESNNKKHIVSPYFFERRYSSRTKTAKVPEKLDLISRQGRESSAMRKADAWKLREEEVANYQRGSKLPVTVDSLGDIIKLGDRMPLTKCSEELCKVTKDIPINIQKSNINELPNPESTARPQSRYSTQKSLVNEKALRLKNKRNLMEFQLVAKNGEKPLKEIIAQTGFRERNASNRELKNVAQQNKIEHNGKAESGLEIDLEKNVDIRFTGNVSEGKDGMFSVQTLGTNNSDEKQKKEESEVSLNDIQKQATFPMTDTTISIHSDSVDADLTIVTAAPTEIENDAVPSTPSTLSSDANAPELVEQRKRVSERSQLFDIPSQDIGSAESSTQKSQKTNSNGKRQSTDAIDSLVQKEKPSIQRSIEGKSLTHEMQIKGDRSQARDSQKAALLYQTYPTAAKVIFRLKQVIGKVDYLKSEVEKANSDDLKERISGNEASTDAFTKGGYTPIYEGQGVSNRLKEPTRMSIIRDRNGTHLGEDMTVGLMEAEGASNMESDPRPPIAARYAADPHSHSSSSLLKDRKDLRIVKNPEIELIPTGDSGHFPNTQVESNTKQEAYENLVKNSTSLLKPENNQHVIWLKNDSVGNYEENSKQFSNDSNDSSRTIQIITSKDRAETSHSVSENMLNHNKVSIESDGNEVDRRSNEAKKSNEPGDEKKNTEDYLHNNPQSKVNSKNAKERNTKKLTRESRRNNSLGIPSITFESTLPEGHSRAGRLSRSWRNETLTYTESGSSTPPQEANRERETLAESTDRNSREYNSGTTIMPRKIDSQPQTSEGTPSGISSRLDHPFEFTVSTSVTSDSDSDTFTKPSTWTVSATTETLPRKSMESSQTVESFHTIDSSQAIDSSQTIDSFNIIDSAQTMESSDTIESSHTIQSSQTKWIDQEISSASSDTPDLEYNNNLTMTVPPGISTESWRSIVQDTKKSDNSSHDVEPPDQWPVKHSAVVEGDLLLGGLMMVHEREDTITCGPVMPQGGIQALEAMLYTLDNVNHRNIVPGVKIGAHILDDCDKDTYGLEMAVDFIKGSISNIDGAEYHCNKTAVRKVISGVVGAASSVTSIQVANLLRLFRIPQVSYFSTSPELSNKQRFEYFTRTIPSDHYQVKAMVDIVRTLGWSYVSIIYEESNYGIKAFEELEELLGKYDICIAIKEKLVKDSGVAKETAYDNIVLKLLTKPRARGCIIFGSDQEVAGVMRAVRRCNATGAFSWIGSDGWSARGLVSDGNEPEVEGTLSVQPQANPVKGFEEYFLNLTVENNRRNPWFVEFWEDHFKCLYPNASRTPYNQNYTNLCTTKERLTKQNTAFEDQLQFVSDAVMAFAYAFRDMHDNLCHGAAGLCEAMKPTQGTELLKYLRKVNFTGLSGDKFTFDKNGDGPARYNIIHFKQTDTGKYKWIRVGEYLEGELRLNMSEIQFKRGHPQPPESVCSLPCEVGQAKKYVEGERCCWHCFNCTQYQIRHPIDETQCIPCRQGTVPDETHSTCRDIPEEFLRPESGWAIGAMSFSATGILITLFVCGVFLRYNDTPVVRASGRELSYVLLSGILLCYLVTFALVLRPTNIVCGIQRFTAGFCFTVVYAALLTKTNRISRIFNASKHSAKRPSFISPRSQLIICSGLVFVQILINGVWMVIDPARAMHHYPTREDNLLVCNSYVDASYMIAFAYPIMLIVVCTVYAVLTRKIPEAFNESKHIGFTMYTTCVIWLAFVPLYFGTGNNVALRITSMSVTISLSASVTIACLFSPKLYIILIRPERNVRQSMMPFRYGTTKSSAGTTNASSMIAPVTLTAATCDQNKAVKKHITTTIDCSTQSEYYELEVKDQKNGKPPPVVVSRSTQTCNSDKEPSLKDSKDSTVPQKQINNNTTRIGNGPVTQSDVTL